MPINNSIYEKLIQTYNYDPDYAVKVIEKNRHNFVTATYYLMLKKALSDKKNIWKKIKLY